MGETSTKTLFIIIKSNTRSGVPQDSSSQKLLPPLGLREPWERKQLLEPWRVAAEDLG